MSISNSNNDIKTDLDKLIIALGGNNNIRHLTHCMTRLRFKIINESIIDIESIKSLEKVKGVVSAQGQLQIIIGLEVEQWYQQLSSMLTESESQSASQPTSNDDKKTSFFQNIMRIIAGIFGPIVPAIAGAGMLMGLLSGLVATKVISPDSDTVFFFRSISEAVFFSLPILVAFSAAKIFKVNEYIAVAVACSMLAPKLIDKAAKLKEAGLEPELTIFGALPIKLLGYGGAIIPTIFAIWLLSKILPMVDRIIPTPAKPVFTPLFAFGLSATLTLSFVGPAGMWLSNGAGWIVSSLLEISPTLTGFVFGLTRPITIVFGVHHSMTPISLNNFALYGRDLLMPIMCLANIAIAGATIAIWYKKKKYVSKESSSITLGSGITAILGITEPALFGILTKYTKALILASVATGIFGAISVKIDTHLNGYILSSIFSLPAYLSGGLGNFIQAVLGIIGVFILSFVLTTLFVKADDI